MARKSSIRTDGLSNKQRILRMVQSWQEDVSYDQAIYHLSVLKAVDEGLKDIEAGRVHDHDEVFDVLERRCDEAESQAALVESSQQRPGTTAKKDSIARRANDGKGVRSPVKESRALTS